MPFRSKTMHRAESYFNKGSYYLGYTFNTYFCGVYIKAVMSKEELGKELKLSAVEIAQCIAVLNKLNKNPNLLFELPEEIRLSLNIQPNEVYKSRDYVLVYESEEQIKNIKIARQTFDQINLDPGGVVVTAEGENCDFVSRFFTPQASILEDPVTGSAHCSLIPFWSLRLRKNQLSAMQISERVGTLQCENKGKRVLIKGKARTYSIGSFWTE